MYVCGYNWKELLLDVTLIRNRKMENYSKKGLQSPYNIIPYIGEETDASREGLASGQKQD